MNSEIESLYKYAELQIKKDLNLFHTFIGKSTPDEDVCKQTPRSAEANSFG